jgi:hypothetical protein
MVESLSPAHSVSCPISVSCLLSVPAHSLSLPTLCLLLTIYLPVIIQLLRVIPPSYVPSDSYPLDCACGSGVRGGGRLVGEGKLVRDGRASASRHRGGCPQGGFLVPVIKACAVKVYAIMAGAVKAGLGSCHSGGCPRSGFWVMLLRRVRVRVLEADQKAYQPRFESRFCSWLLWPAKPSRELVLLGSLHAL